MGYFVTGSQNESLNGHVFVPDCRHGETSEIPGYSEETEEGTGVLVCNRPLEQSMWPQYLVWQSLVALFQPLHAQEGWAKAPGREETQSWASPRTGSPALGPGWVLRPKQSHSGCRRWTQHRKPLEDGSASLWQTDIRNKLKWSFAWLFQASHCHFSHLRGTLHRGAGAAIPVPACMQSLLQVSIAPAGKSRSGCAS